MYSMFRFALLILLVAACTAPATTTIAENTPASSPTVSSDNALSVDEVSSADEKPSTDEYAEKRHTMVSAQIQRRGVEDEAVLEALRTVPRHRFVPDDLVTQAYADHPLPIGYGQTISQPYIVALMSESLTLEPGDRVLEIGTGSAYQAAVLAQLGAETYTIEIIPELAQQAEERLRSLGYTDVKVLNADGYHGWEEYAPFDAVIVTAAPDHLPQPLANQLAEGGRLVIPIGPTGSYQTLWLFEKHDGEIQATNLGAVSFVPFTRNAHK